MNPGSQLASCDVAVVGGGVIGLATALALRDAGASVAVFDQGAFGRAASWAGGGILSPLPPGECPAALQPLLDDSLQRYPQWCEQLHADTGIDPEYWTCGAIHQTASGERRWLPSLAQVRNPRLCRALVARAVQRQVQLHGDTAVLGWQRAGDRVVGLHSAAGHLSCQHVILAAGAWSARLADVPVSPVKGQMLLLRTAPGELGHMLIGDEAYLVPRRDGALLLGSTLEQAGFDRGTTGVARERLLSLAEDLLPGVRRYPVEAQWAGLRPASATGLPLIGADARLAGLWHCSGHHRIGITLAPGSAALIASLVTGTAPTPEAQAFRPPAPAPR